MTVKHTPGPWVLFNKSRTLAIHDGDGDDAKPIVAWPGFDSADVGGHAVNVANAKLIAAAPELAAALEALLTACNALLTACNEDNLIRGLAAKETARVALRAAGRLP
jgi:hypothetical protein